MTLSYKFSNGCFIDHGDYISGIYKTVKSCDHINLKCSYELNPMIFCIKNSKKDKQCSRKRNHDQNHTDAICRKVSQQYEVFKQSIPSHIQEKIKEKYNIGDTKEVRELSHNLFDATKEKSYSIGGNNSEYSLKCLVGNEYCLIPPISRFYAGHVEQQCVKLQGNKYDILVADPPWWNKYIRRLKTANDILSYSMMYNEDIANLPVKDLLADNCLVAVWCTNAPSCINAVKNIIFPKWGVEYVTTWYWLKLTIDLEPVCPFSLGCQKQPYERLILGRFGQVKNMPDENVVLSIPSALHSHKPPLIDLLTPYVNTERPKILELFARYLLPNTTSVGYEPLKWQHLSVYKEVNNKVDIT